MARTVAPSGRWREYWAGKSSPEHAQESDNFYHAHARELRMLFPDREIDRVLEIGCGDGSLYDHLGFRDVGRYVGVDFSPAMLARFRARFAPVELVLGDGENYHSDEEFDLVFANQVAQYWEPEQLSRFLSNARSMLAEGGSIVVAGIPWSRMRLAYARGDMTGGRRQSWPMTLLNVVHELVFARMGRWYELPELERLGVATGLQAYFLGSAHYPYRVHAVFDIASGRDQQGEGRGNRVR